MSVCLFMDVPSNSHFYLSTYALGQSFCLSLSICLRLCLCLSLRMSPGRCVFPPCVVNMISFSPISKKDKSLSNYESHAIVSAHTEYGLLSHSDFIITSVFTVSISHTGQLRTLPKAERDASGIGYTSRYLYQRHH